MKRVLLLITILSVSVLTSACINNFAVKELNTKAESYLDKGDTETAICRLKSSLDLDDGIYQTHYNLAVAYNNINNYEGVLEESQKVLDINPEFYDAIYMMALAKEALAYKLIENVENPYDLSLEQLSDFNNKASDAIDTYNKYLENKVNATESDKINSKISELNAKIKEYTEVYDNKNNEVQNQIQDELNNQNSDMVQDTENSENGNQEEAQDQNQAQGTEEVNQ